MTEQQLEDYHTALGQRIIDLFHLPIIQGDRVATAWGTKTPLGLGRTICRIVDEEDEKRFDLEENSTGMDELRSREWHEATQVTVT